LEEVVEKVRNAAKGAASATGAKVNIKPYAHRYESMWNNRALAAAFQRNLALLGLPISNQYRRGFVTDMGNVSRVTPSIQPFIKVAPEGTAFHSEEAARAVASKEARDATVNAAKAIAMTTIDVIVDHDLAERIRQEFTDQRERHPRS